jgi:CRISPR-associated endonuclease Csn1
VFGKVNLHGIKIPKGKIAVATRKELTPDIDLTKITDTGIQKILKNYLATKNNDPKLAFSPEGIEEMNKNIALYNDGKIHQPILKVRVYELGSRFALGIHGNKPDKYVEAAKGTNLFFAIYADNDGNRSYETIPLNEVIERLKQRLNPVPEKNQKGIPLLFHLSPNDLVYVPTEEELENRVDMQNFDISRIYKMVSCTKGECHFIPHRIASPIVQTTELGSNNKSERSWDGVMIKQVCVKLNIDRLGNIRL